MKRAGYILSVMSMLVLVSIQLSPALLPFFEEPGTRIQICTTEGIKTIVFAEDGTAVEQTEDHDILNDHCPLCTLRTATAVEPALKITPEDFGFSKTGFEPTPVVSLSSQTAYTRYLPRDPPHLYA